MKLGIVQYESRASHRESLESLRSLLAAQRVEAELILLPEYADLSPRLGRRLAEEAKPLEENPFLAGLVDLASEHGAVIVAGVVEKSGSCLYSTVASVDASGRISRLYRKRLLFDALGYRESSIFCRGTEPPRLLELQEMRVAPLVCYELRFPEAAREAALRGATVVAYVAAWYPGPGKEEQLRFLAQARASENTVYVAVADQPAPGFTGRSMVVDPRGVVVLDAGPWPGYVEAQLSPAALRDAREGLPVLTQSRGLWRWLYEAQCGEDQGGGHAVD